MNKVFLSNRGMASSVTLSSITINSFTRPLKMFLCYFVFYYPVFLSNLFTCSLNHVPLLLCLPLSCLRKQAVDLSNKKSAKTFRSWHCVTNAMELLLR